MASDEHQRDSPTPSANDEREECFLQLINVTRHNDNDVLELNNNALESVLETSQGRPLVILSVVDNHNPHPSVLPMHIKCSLEALENSNVSSQTSAPPCSFNENDESEGIWVWSRAFLLENDDDEIAIILMHLNHRNFTNISTSILELPILLSSAVVYKIDANQLENALNSLQPIFRYGQLCTDKGSDLLNDQKPLPAVCFFLDNALEAAEKSEAKDGRSAYLEERVESLDEDKRDVTWDGFNCFQKVLEFLQSPNPSPTNQVDSLLEAFLSKVLKDEDVMSKKQILGKPVTPSEFIRYFQEYVAIITNTSGTVNEDVLWNSTCAVYHNNIIASCLTAYEASVNRKIKSLDLPSSEILQISHNTALKQAKLLFKKAKMLDSFRQSYEKKLESEINSSFQVMVDKIKSIRRDAIENCSKRIVEKFETQLDSLFSNDEDAVITSKGKRLSEKLLNEFQEEFEGDDEDDLATAVDLLQQKFKRIIELYLEQQKTETESAKKEVSIFQEELIQRYTDNMQQIMDKNSFMDAETLIKFHNVNLRSVMKQLDSKSTNAKGLSVDYKRSNIEHSIQNAFSEFQKQQQANFTKLVDKAENSINDEVEAFSNTLVNKNEIDAEISELELKDFKEKELSVIIARFNKNYPFPSSSHEGVKLQVKLQERLETKYQSQIEDHLRKLEENGKENEGACILLYRKEMQANQGNVDFLLEEECLEAHQKSFNMALQRYNKCQQKSVENVADFKRKIQAEFTTIIFQNNQCLEVARSNADSWMAECLNDYNLQMEHFNSSCQTEDDFRFAHEETKANSISLFSKKWQYSNASLRQQYEKELVKQMDPIFSELEDLFLMRMTTGKVTAADSKEEVQKYYHEEMEKHFKNRHFIRPEELHALHKQARKAAIGICKKKKIITSSQKNALKQWLESSFQKYKDINDANLNWVDGAEPAIGIDLGTTFCCAAVLHHGEVKIIPNPQGKNTTPSYVTINKDGSYIVGSTAKDNAHRNTENTIFDAKRIIGRQMRDPQLQNDMTYWPFKVAQGGTGPTLDISGKHYTPEEIASYILKQIVQDASAYLQTPIKKVVITVPAYFTDGQRAATLDAGELAGLEVLEILNEPTAAAIAYKLERFHEESRNVLIFDMGGGTFDVAVINTDSTSIEVLSVDGDTHLGGEDFDKALMHLCLKKFQEQDKVNPITGNKLGTKTAKDVTKQRLRRLQTECENAKIQLSYAPVTTISVDSFYNGMDLLIPITREEFEELIESLFNKAIHIVDRVLKDAKISKRHIHDIVLIGGSTRIPRVQELISEFFDGKALNHTISPDEAVAYGSAVKAAILNGDQSKKMYNFKHIRDVIPRSLGIQSWMFDQEGQFIVIIPKSAKIPAEATQEFRTKLDNQGAVKIKIFQGEDIMAADNEYLGEFILREIPPAPAGQEVIEVCMRVNNMGILHVTAVCKSTNGSETLIVSENKGRLSVETKNRIAGNKKMTKINKESSDMPTQPQQQSQKKSGVLRWLNTFKQAPK